MGNVTQKIVTLHTTATATGNGVLAPCHRWGSAGVYINNTTGSFTITFEGTVDGTNFVSLRAVNSLNGNVATTASANGHYIVDIGRVSHFRARISTASSCSVTVTAVMFAEGADIGAAADVSLAPAISITQTPTISTGIYASGDCCGGLLTFANAARVSGESGIIQTVVITDLAKQDADFDLLLFDRTFTAGTDNAELDVSDTDILNMIGHIDVSAADYADLKDNSAATVRNVGLGFTANATSIFGQLVIRAAKTYASTQDVQVTVNILRE